MLNDILRTFARSVGWNAGRQAMRSVGWLIWPVLLILLALIVASQVGILPPGLAPALLDFIR
jgi:hypothetical protein